MTPSRFQRLLCLALTALLAALGGCIPPVPWPDDAIGRITVNGPAATLNQRPVYSGAFLREGDTLATGSATWARVDLRQGGVVNLDQNTDPLFQTLANGFATGRCLLVKVIFGRVYMHGDGLCEEDNNQAGALHSSVLLRTGPAGSHLLVLAGSVSLIRPIAATVSTGQMLEVLPRAAPVIRAANPQEMLHALDGLYGPIDLGPAPPQQVWCCRAGSVSQASAAVCSSERGQAYPTRERAVAACKPPPIIIK